MKFIPLDAVLAEINRLIAELVEKGEDTMFEQGRISAFEDAKLFLDTLEVKEVDIEKEVIDWWNAHYSSKAYTFEGYTGHYIENSTLIEIAKHFFELGVNASNPLTWEDIKLIWNIGDDLPYMPEEDFFKELSQRYKAQKGE